FGAASNFATGQDPTQLAVADFNDDGRPDLAVTDQGPLNPDVAVLLANGAGTFAAPTSLSFGLHTIPGVAAADVNRDGKPDLVVGVATTVSVVLGDGAGGFGTATGFPTEPSAGAPSIGDINGDRIPDVAVPTQPHNIDVLTGDGNGGFSRVAELSAH